jgi:hypothetical protein
MGEFRIDSEPATIEIPARPAAPAITADSANGTQVDGKLIGTTVDMRYRRAGTTAWIRATADTTLVAAGEYDVRVWVVEGVSFAGEMTRVTVSARPVSVAQSDREIPGGAGREQSVVAPVTRLEVALTVGPSPVSKNAGNVGIFWQGGAVASGTLFVFDASGNMVNRITVGADNASSSERRQIAGWNLSDRRGRQVSEGTYIVRGTLTLKDGGKSAVSTVFGVTK